MQRYRCKSRRKFTAKNKDIDLSSSFPISIAIPFKSPKMLLRSESPSSCFAFSYCYSQTKPKITKIGRARSHILDNRNRRHLPRLSAWHLSLREEASQGPTALSDLNPTFPSAVGQLFWVQKLSMITVYKKPHEVLKNQEMKQADL